jgi:hypothetical protein
MGYRIDVCRITKGGHIEHLWEEEGKERERDREKKQQKQLGDFLSLSA